jgi:hypothetical protein
MVVRDCPVFTPSVHFSFSFIRDEYNTNCFWLPPKLLLFWPVYFERRSIQLYTPRLGMLSSRKVLSILSNISYGLLIIITIIMTGISCVALLAQAVRHSPTRSYTRNFNALIIGASYGIVVRRPILAPYVCSSQRATSSSCPSCSVSSGGSRCACTCGARRIPSYAAETCPTSVFSSSVSKLRVPNTRRCFCC